jgi:hypothetical protein
MRKTLRKEKIGLVIFAAILKANIRPVLGAVLAAVLALASGVIAQELPMKVKGGHQLGETAEQFFAEGQEKETLSACAVGDFKSVIKAIRRPAKKFCDDLANTRQLAVDGKREEYQSDGDSSELRKDTFTFDSGHLVKVELVYSAPSAESNYRGHSFKELFEGVKQTYGPPTNETTKPTQDTYGVPYLAHRELWLAPMAAVLITEQPVPGGPTTLVAFTRAEYDRTVAAGEPKPANPLQ